MYGLLWMQHSGQLLYGLLEGNDSKWEVCSLRCLTTLHRICSPQSAYQADYYSSHQHYHCSHTQIAIDNPLTMRHISLGSLSRNNDAQTFRLMKTIGLGQQLDFLRNFYLRRNMRHPSRRPIVAPYSASQPTSSHITSLRKHWCKASIRRETLSHLVSAPSNCANIKESR